MFLHAIAFDTIDLTALLIGTGGESVVRLGMRKVALAGARARHQHGRYEAFVDAAPAHGPTAEELGNVHARHNAAASVALHVPWCQCEQDEERIEAIVGLELAAEEEAGVGPPVASMSLLEYTRLVAARIRGRPTLPCTCIANEATGVNLLQAYERDREAEVGGGVGLGRERLVCPASPSTHACLPHPAGRRSRRRSQGA